MTTSAYRLIKLGAAPRSFGVVLTGTALRWPVAQPDDNLDYSLDISVALADVDDDVAVAHLSASPSGEGELAAADLSVAGSVITGFLSGGVAGRDYTVKIDVQTAAGRQFSWLLGLLVSPDLAADPIPQPASDGFGTPITWSYHAGFDLSNPRNSGYIALLAGF